MISVFSPERNLRVLTHCIAAFYDCPHRGNAAINPLLHLTKLVLNHPHHRPAQRTVNRVQIAIEPLMPQYSAGGSIKVGRFLLLYLAAAMRTFANQCPFTFAQDPGQRTHLSNF